MKKKVIAYLHTHWDREWYREFEIFRLRLLRVFDNILNLLENGKIPCFYFDGQTSAIDDYLELNPEKETLVRKLIKQKKLFIGPCYTLVDEFLTDGVCFRKNLKIGIKYAKSLGCEDFLGYFADTFGHSKNIPAILKEFGIDKAIVWRGCPEDIPSEFLFDGIKTVNLIQGYFMDIFSGNSSIKEKSDFLQKHLDKIAQKSQNVLLLPIGADHLDIETDISEQIKEVNKYLKDYEIELASPFKYFELVKNNFQFQHNDELRDNSSTFILQGSYSARTKLKQYNVKCSYMLDLANKFQKFSQKKYKTKSYENVIEYAYKLLLQNQAHDGICGCSTDLVHQENVMRYEKVLQIANTIIEELKLEIGESSLIINLSDEDFSGLVQFKSAQKLPEKDCQIIAKRRGFNDELLYNTQKIPVTEDYTNIYTYLTEIKSKSPSKLLSKPNKLYCQMFDPFDLKVSQTKLENANISIMIKNAKIIVTDKHSGNIYNDFIKFVDCKDEGDSYNFAPAVNDLGFKSSIISSKILRQGRLQCALGVKFKIGNTVLNTEISLNKGSKFLNFKINWNNKTKNHLLQAKFNLEEPIAKTFSEDMNTLIERDFDPDYDIRTNLPKAKGIEVKTNTAPMGRCVSAQGFEVITKGLCEYEVKKNFLLITILRAIGMISNPKNPARTTSAGPPIDVKDAQQLGKNTAQFSIGFGDEKNWRKSVEEIYPHIIVWTKN
ncbi:MAG: glycoside hydrolase family 38 C-terminal domain-containing protein [bacterium]